MSKDEATALFERVYETLSQCDRAFRLHLVYYHPPVPTGKGLPGKPTWSVVIGSWNSVMEWHFAKESDWEVYKLDFLQSEEAEK